MRMNLMRRLQLNQQDPGNILDILEKLAAGVGKSCVKAFAKAIGKAAKSFLGEKEHNRQKNFFTDLFNKGKEFVGKLSEKLQKAKDWFGKQWEKFLPIAKPILEEAGPKCLAAFQEKFKEILGKDEI